MVEACDNCGAKVPTAKLLVDPEGGIVACEVCEDTSGQAKW